MSGTSGLPNSMSRKRANLVERDASLGASDGRGDFLAHAVRSISDDAADLIHCGGTISVHISERSGSDVPHVGADR